MRELNRIEVLVAQLATSNREAQEVARLLGTKTREQAGTFWVHVGKVPFESAKVSRFREDIDIEFELSAGSWRLSDITENPESWSEPPRLPDTGQLEIFRDWDWRHVSIRCIARVEGDGPVKDYLIQSVRCQVSPP